jgi:ribosomal protein S12 methylthiotransferase
MPLQHIHPRMLELMRRETSREHIENLIARIRAGIPGIALRTTFIVGFPGETEEHFESLLEFIEHTRFERLGVFHYSQEEGSRAAKMPDQIPVKIRNARHRRAMKLQQNIARSTSSSHVGKTMKVLVEKPFAARSEADAPEIDCQVILDRPAAVGEFATVRITGTQVYDLVGQLT